MDSGLTPVRVRGKRNVTSSTESTANEQQNAPEVASACEPSPSTHSSNKPLPKKASLEGMPLELISIIFIMSNNVDLPLVSRTLAVKLSDKRLHSIMIDRLLPVFFNSHPNVRDDNFLEARKLLNRRCVTWSAFQQWLDHNVVSEDFEWDGGYGTPEEKLADYYVAQLESRKHDLRSVPSRIFRSPWTGDRLKFLCFWKAFIEYAEDVHDEVRAALANEALYLAIQEGSVEAVRQLLKFGRPTFPDILDAAVITYGCNLDIVEAILFRSRQADDDERRSRWERGYALGLGRLESDRIWVWADQPQQVQSGKGALLIARLKAYNREREEHAAAYKEW